MPYKSSFQGDVLIHDEELDLVDMPGENCPEMLDHLQLWHLHLALRPTLPYARIFSRHCVRRWCIIHAFLLLCLTFKECTSGAHSFIKDIGD